MQPTGVLMFLQHFCEGILVLAFYYLTIAKVWLHLVLNQLYFLQLKMDLFKHSLSLTSCQKFFIKFSSFMFDL